MYTTIRGALCYALGVNSYRVAILGATGAVGQEMLSLLAKRHFPTSAVRLLASPRSSGRTLPFRGVNVPVSAVAENLFDDVQIAFFSAGAETAKTWAPVALDKGAIVIDNSSAFRMEQNVPLVIPEINWDSVKPTDRLFPVGNCTAIILMMAIAPLQQYGKLKRVVVSTYQSVSGAGARAMDELATQMNAIARGDTPKAEVFPQQIACNLFSHNTPINEHGYNGEEWKVIQETQKTLGLPNLKIDVTCIRVPVMRAHSLSVNVELESPAPSPEQIRETYAKAKGVRVVDDREGNHFPTPCEAADIDDVLIGRIRQDVSNPNAISLFCSGDQLRKGAALNGIQIAERLAAEALV
jgi:aspartate-semialdehyde dehydrogenase